jgi:diguanylate cyclase (GGDEF)-like protein
LQPDPTPPTQGIFQLRDLLQAGEGVLRSFLEEQTQIAIAILNRELQIRDCNQGLLRLLELPEKPLGLKLGDFLLPESRLALGQALANPQQPLRLALRSGSTPVRLLCCQLYVTAGEVILFGERAVETSEQTLHKISSLNEQMTNLLRDIQKKNRALNRANNSISQLMNTDSLTGLANRRCFMEQLPLALAEARRHRLPLTLVMADLDHFKQINDRYGHAGGDQVLTLFAGLLQEQGREGQLPARFGGEEFIILLPFTDLRGGILYAERVRSRLAATPIAGIPQTVTASFGVACLLPEESPESLLKRADDALYQAKGGGRNQVGGGPATP